MRKLRVLFYDIETLPTWAYIFRPHVEYISPDMMEQEVFMLGWAAKWADADEIGSTVMTPEEALAQDDTRVVSELAEQIREADLIVAHNIDRFDLPMTNNRLLLLEQEPLVPVRTIDTLKLAKKSFNLQHNRLTWLARMLFGDDKIKTDFDLWKECFHGNPEALAEMQEYNRYDVTLLEKVYWRMYPYVKGLPRLIEATEFGEFCCTYCGSTNLIKRGFHTTGAGTFQTWQCKDCGRYSKTPTANSMKLALRPMPQ